MARAPSTASHNPETAARAPSSAAHSTPAAHGSAAADLTALTTRDDFLLDLGQALEGRAGVRPVDSLAEAVAAMKGARRAQVLVIDAREISDVRGAVESLHGEVPQAVCVVFAEGSAEKELAARLKGSRVFSVLSTAIEPRKTQAVLEGAIAEALAGKAAAPAEPRAAQAPLTLGAFRPQTAQPPPAERAGIAKVIWPAAAVAVATLAAGGYWYFAAPGQAPVGPVKPAPAAAAAAPAAAAHPEGAASTPASPATNFLVEGKVDELLEKARLAMHQRRYTEPAGDNALLYYRSAAAADSANGEAQDGLQRVAGVLAGRFEEALTAGRLDEATLTLGNFKAAAAADPRLGGFEQRLYSAQMAKALADGNLERAATVLRQAQQAGSLPGEQLARWRSDIGRRQEDAKAQHLAALAEERMRDGRLADGDDSARAYVQQLEAASPSHAATQRVVRELTAAYLKKGREAALAKNSADQDHWLNEARALGLKPAELTAFQREVAGARQKAAQADAEHALALARTALRDGRLTEPAQDSAAWYLAQAQSSDASSAGVAESGRELAARLLERARTAVLAGKPADADLAQARRWGADSKDLAAVQQLAAAKAKALDPATLAASLKRLRAPPPDYPPSALAQQVSGSVTLEFTVDTRGEPRDIRVTEATPPGVFNQAAINAVKHWRYAPLTVDGAAVEVPVRTRMRFELPK